MVSQVGAAGLPDGGAGTIVAGVTAALTWDQLPARRAICEDCRTLLAEGVPCDLGRGHGVVAPGDGRRVKRLLAQTLVETRSALVARPRRHEVRRPAPLEVKQSALLGAIMTVVVVLTAAIDFGAGWLVAVALAVATGAAVSAAALHLPAVLEGVPQIRPRAGRAYLASGVGYEDARRGARGHAGTILPGAAVQAPLSRIPCVAFAVTVRVAGSHGRDILLRDGYSVGFTLELDHGGTVAIPAGRVRIEGDGPWLRHETLAAYVHVCAPWLAQHPAFAHVDKSARELLLRPGDRVEVIADTVEAAPDPGAASGPYRDAAPTTVVVTGIPVIRLVGTVGS